MCLKLASEKTRVEIAKEDIVCYKELEEREYLDVSFLKDGDKFTGVIKGISCEGAVSIEEDKVFFCTNEKHLNGRICKDKKGYAYSWMKDDDVSEINGVTWSSRLETLYRNFPVEIGSTYTSELNKFGDEVEEGLHSYRSAERRGNTIVAKCIIPKGARYYKGKFSGEDSYASDTLIYVEIVKE